MAEIISTEVKQEKAVLIGASFSPTGVARVEEYLDELEFLASTLGLDSVKRYTQKLQRPEP
jgi:GTP-binding protein HflX